MSSVGKFLVVAGVVLVVLGLVVLAAGRIPYLGKLPGHLRWEGENWTVYLPLTTCIILSIVLTLILNLVVRFFLRR